MVFLWVFFHRQNVSMMPLLLLLVHSFIIVSDAIDGSSTKLLDALYATDGKKGYNDALCTGMLPLWCGIEGPSSVTEGNKDAATEASRHSCDNQNN